MSVSGPINLDDYEAAAREKLPQTIYDYYAGGSWDEITLRENCSAFDKLRLRYRVLRDVSSRSLATTLLGHELKLPVIIAPTAFHQMADEQGEVATARAAGSVGTVMIVSTLSNKPIEEIVAAASGPVWFQLYVYKDRQATEALLRRAEQAGCSAIVLTVDAQLWGIRERDVRNQFQLPDGLEMSNLVADKKSFPEASGSGLQAYVTDLFDTSLNWNDLDWLCATTKLPVLVKGIIHPDDARLAVEHGARGVVVSNHGGRQVDGCLAAIDALSDVVKTVHGQAEVLVDGGIRRGSDVVKALALGAKAVAIGRPVLWGLATAGQHGVEHVFEVLRNELDIVMGLCGASEVAQMNQDLLQQV